MKYTLLLISLLTIFQTRARYERVLRCSFPDSDDIGVKISVSNYRGSKPIKPNPIWLFDNYPTAISVHGGMDIFPLADIIRPLYGDRPLFTLDEKENMVFTISGYCIDGEMILFERKRYKEGILNYKSCQGDTKSDVICTVKRK